MAWALEGLGASKVTRFQINTKSVKTSMMNISIESLSLTEDTVSDVTILRIFFFLFSIAVRKNKALLLIKDYSRNITIYVLSKYLQLLGSNYYMETVTSIATKPMCRFMNNANFQSPSPKMLLMKFGLN